MTVPDPKAPQKSDFLVAEAMKEMLQGREKAEQERILRWVSESLDLSISPSRPTREHTQHLSHPPMSQPNEPAPSHSTGTGLMAKDIRSFVQEKQPKSDVQFVAVIAYYYQFIVPEVDRKAAITSDDLQTAARQAQYPVFKTPSITLNNAVQQGYVDRAARGAYRLNAVGENLVAMTLPGANGEIAGKRSAKKRRSKAKPSKKVNNKKRPRTS